MICFLTSNPFLEDGLALNPANGFVEALKKSLPAGAIRGVFVASSPDEPDTNNFYAAQQKAAFETSGVAFETFDILDRRNARQAAALVSKADLVILTGGHVPTQNAFFRDIGLKALLSGFGGAIVGISAGTMNAASSVYAQPELEGEGVDPDYQRFLPGLGLTDAMILPHFDGNLFAELDGLRIYADITFPDSLGRRFYLLPDGSWLHIEGGVETLRGEAYLIENGALRPFSDAGESVRL